MSMLFSTPRGWPIFPRPALHEIVIPCFQSLGFRAYNDPLPLSNLLTNLIRRPPKKHSHQYARIEGCKRPVQEKPHPAQVRARPGLEVLVVVVILSDRHQQ